MVAKVTIANPTWQSILILYWKEMEIREARAVCVPGLL